MRVLRQHADRAEYLEIILEHTLADLPLEPADRGLIQELTFGVVRWQATLDWLIARKTHGRNQKGALQILLRLGLYQLFWLSRIPDHAAVHETVEMAKRLGFGAQAGFVNAVLRTYLRERAATEQELRDLKTAQPALGYSHPAWLCGRWEERWGTEKLPLLLAWNNTPPPTYARVNTLRATPETLAAQFETEGVHCVPRPCDWVGPDLVFELKSHPPLGGLPSFQQGQFYIQDPSTLLAVCELDPHPGESVLDLCAAPGGKTMFIAQLMNNQGQIMAHDLQIHRRELIRQNCDRLGVTCVQLARSTTTVSPDPTAPYDRILVDAPCSNTGVLRRRVDLRWRIRPEEILRLRGTQVELLQQAAPQLKLGGALVYSTCSLEREENEEVTQEFLRAHPGWRLETERILLPFVEGVDGAYVARFSRGQ